MYTRFLQQASGQRHPQNHNHQSRPHQEIHLYQLPPNIIEGTFMKYFEQQKK